MTSKQNIRNSISVLRDKAQGAFETEKTTEEALADTARSLKECVKELRAIDAKEVSNAELDDIEELGVGPAQGNRAVEDTLAKLLLKTLEALYIAEDNGDADLTRVLQILNSDVSKQVEELASLQDDDKASISIEDMMISEEALFDEMDDDDEFDVTESEIQDGK